MKYKIFDYLWHIPHQTDMVSALVDDCDFYFALNVKAQWDHNKRKMPPNVNFVTHYEPGYYDMAILHIDQQVIAPSDRKRIIYEDFNKVIDDIPKVVINHGSPVLNEWFERNHIDCSGGAGEQICREEIRKIVGTNVMIVNSHAAASEKEWGFGYPIVHGLCPSQWINLPKEPRVFTAVSPGGFDTYYNRACLQKVSKILDERFGYTLHHARVNVDTDKSPDAYRRFLGSSLIYFDPSVRTPMNRARTEAFLSGCCVVQVEGAHDLERWAVNGKNIILVPDDPDQIAATIADLIENRYGYAAAIGQAGKQMAEKEFGYDRYRRDWLTLIGEVVKNEKSMVVNL